MKKDNQQLLDGLKGELQALESGHYSVSPEHAWRPRLVFEDSTCCPNFVDKEHRTPCADCALIDLVPNDRRHEKIPCRFIPLNAKGDTVDSLYRCGTQQELETALAKWLRKTIREMEKKDQTTGVRPAPGPFR